MELQWEDVEWVSFEDVDVSFEMGRRLVVCSGRRRRRGERKKGSHWNGDKVGMGLTDRITGECFIRRWLLLVCSGLL